jgi:hypothetical protein
VDSHIADQLPQLLGSSSGASQLESVGRQMVERGLDRPLDAISAEVAAQTGAPVQATRAITGIVGATLLGLLKRHFLEGQGNVGQLPALLGQQLPVIAPYLNDCLLGALGVGGLGAFTGSILSQLKAVSVHIEQPTPAAKPVPDMLASIPGAAGCGRARRAPVVAQAAAASGAAVSTVEATVASAPIAASAEATASATSDAPTKDSQLSFIVASGKPTLTATVGSEAEKAQLIDELTKRIGAHNFV